MIRDASLFVFGRFAVEEVHFKSPSFCKSWHIVCSPPDLWQWKNCGCQDFSRRTSLLKQLLAVQTTILCRPAAVILPRESWPLFQYKTNPISLEKNSNSDTLFKRMRARWERIADIDSKLSSIRIWSMFNHTWQALAHCWVWAMTPETKCYCSHDVYLSAGARLSMHISKNVSFRWAQSYFCGW